MRLLKQRRAFDCGVACVAMLTRTPYEDVYVVAIRVANGKIREGLSMRNIQKVTAKFGRRLQFVHPRKIDLETDIGILGINYVNKKGKKEKDGHVVVLHQGSIVDPEDLELWDAEDYLKGGSKDYKIRWGYLLKVV